jgi:putative acetyltransferase
MADVIIRRYAEADLHAVVDLFTRSVHEIASRSYTPSQLNAWAPPMPDVEIWANRLRSLSTFVAERNDGLAGFVSVKLPAHIELLYTCPRFARMGVASRLYRHAMSVTSPAGTAIITTRASIEARPFFERHGLGVLERQVVERNGKTFLRFLMSSAA